VSALVCWNCGQALDHLPQPLSRQATCPACFHELHCCRLCQHLDPRATTTCLEDRADPPVQKDNANFCEFFSPQVQAFRPADTNHSKQAREQLNALFTDSPVPADHGTTVPGERQDALGTDAFDPAAAAKKKLEDLFR